MSERPRIRYRSVPQEIIGGPKGTRTEAEEFLSSLRHQLREHLKPVLAAPEFIPPQLKEFERTLHTVNKARAEYYGRKYAPTQVFYVDALLFYLHKKEIWQSLDEAGLSMYHHIGEAVAGVFYEIGNVVMVFVNNFEHENVDLYDAAKKLRHELSHAGSVRKGWLNRFNPKTYENYRIGANIISSDKRGVKGTVLDESYHAVEDQIFDGQYPKLRAQNSFLSSLPLSSDISSFGKYQFSLLDETLRQRGVVDEEHMITAYHNSTKYPEIGERFLGTAKNYDAYGDFMHKLLEQSPKLFKLTADFIYGDQMVAFAKEIEHLFGKGSFRELMNVMDKEQLQAFQQKYSL